MGEEELDGLCRVRETKRDCYHQGALHGCRLEDQRHCRSLFDLGGPGESPGAGPVPEELCANLELSSKFVLCFCLQSLRTVVAGVLSGVEQRESAHCLGVPFLGISFLFHSSWEPSSSSATLNSQLSQTEGMAILALREEKRETR